MTPEQGIPTTVFDYSTRRSNLGVLKIAASAKYRGIPSASSGYGSATSGYSSASSGCRSEISGYSSASSGYRSEISGYSSALRFPTSSQKSSDSHPEGSDAVLSNKRVLNPPVQFQYHSDKQVLALVHIKALSFKSISIIVMKLCSSDYDACALLC